MNHCGCKFGFAPEIVVKTFNIKFKKNTFNALWDPYIDRAHFGSV